LQSARILATASDRKRIDIITRATAINDFVDVGPSGLTPGDIYVFINDVFLANAPNERVGRALGRCTVINPASARLGCLIRTSLPGGSITTDGTLINVPGTRSLLPAEPVGGSAAGTTARDGARSLGRRETASGRLASERSTPTTAAGPRRGF
jgi:hypothetical protein